MNPTHSPALQFLRKSLTFKVFLVCFVSVHVPLIATVLFLATGQEGRPVPLLLLLLGATLVGTIACLTGLWIILKPLKTLTSAVQRYRDDGQPVRMNLARQDEIGLLATGVTAMVSEVEGLIQKLRHQAMTDPLTGLGNRRWLNERISQELARAERQCEPLSIIVFDLDHFKAINDRHGHDIGDQVLVAAGEVINHNVRPYDLSARIGGEEFCVVLPKTNEEEAVTIAERLRLAFTRTIVAPLKQGRVTASFGVYQSQPGEGLQRMLHEADKLLYDAKSSGRNCVRFNSDFPKRAGNDADFG